MVSGPFLQCGGLLAGAVCLIACTTLGPDYEEPDSEWLGRWQSDLYGQASQAATPTAADLRFWWHLFNDPVLNEIVETARRENPTLRIAGLRILESRATLGIADSNRFPQVQQLGGALSYVNTQQHGGSGFDDDRSFASYQTGLALGWELDFWGRFRRGIESADAAFLASLTSFQDVQVLLSAQVADLYYAYRTVLLRIAIARRNAAIQKRSYEITEKLFRAGEDSELDLQQAKTQYLATLSSIPDLEITLTQVRNALAAILGRPPGDLPEVGSVIQPLPSVEPIVIGGIPSRLLLRRPDVRTAAWGVAVQSAQIGIALADYYPAISLVGSLDWSGNSLGGSPDTASLIAGPAFTWNIFDYGRIRNNVRLQDARLQQTIEAFQDTVLQAAREIDDAAISVIKTREQQSVLNESVRSAERSLELANRRYQEGYADFQRVLDAQRAAASQAERELINQGSHIAAIIDLYKAIGGGWSDADIEEIIPQDTRDAMQDRTDWGELLHAPLPVDATNGTTNRAIR